MMSTRSLPIRRGFTLVELMVVIAVIMVLVGVLMPAIGLFRESSRAMACKGNLRQQALACQSYAQSQGVLPNALASKSVFCQILPYVEQLALHDMAVALGSTGTTSNAWDTVGGTVVPLFGCPTRGSTIITNVQPAGVRRSRGDYAGVGANVGYQNNQGILCNPPYSSLPGRPMSVITDGISNVFMLGERYLEPGKYNEQAFLQSFVTAPPPWAYYNTFNGCGWVNPQEGQLSGFTSGGTDPRVSYLQKEKVGIPVGYGKHLLSPTVPPDWSSPNSCRMLGGPHDNQHMAMVDASVREVNYNMPQRTFEKFIFYNDSLGFVDQLSQ